MLAGIQELAFHPFEVRSLSINSGLRTISWWASGPSSPHALFRSIQYSARISLLFLTIRIQLFDGSANIWDLPWNQWNNRSYISSSPLALFAGKAAILSKDLSIFSGCQSSFPYRTWIDSKLWRLLRCESSLLLQVLGITLQKNAPMMRYTDWSSDNRVSGLQGRRIRRGFVSYQRCHFLLQWVSSDWQLAHLLLLSSLHRFSFSPKGF